MTKEQIYGTKANTVSGFVEAYDKSWSQAPAQAMVDRLELFSSVFWASLRLDESRNVARNDKSHSSITNVSGLGTAAYEATDPPHTQGFLADTIPITQAAPVPAFA